MIIITELKTTTVDHDPHEIRPSFSGEVVAVGGANAPNMLATEVLELVRGRRFNRPDGSTLVIGNSRAVQDLIGIQYEAWDEAERRHEETAADFSAAQRQVKSLEFVCAQRRTAAQAVLDAPWWRRLQWVFVGLPI